MDRKELIRTIYLYLFSFIGLVLITVGSVRFVDLALKMFIFTKADQVLVYPKYPRALAPGEKEIQPLTPEEEARFLAEQEAFELKNRESQRQRTAAESLAMILVGLPVFLYHWRVIQKSKER